MSNRAGETGLMLTDLTPTVRYGRSTESAKFVGQKRD
jgi:hypothetical protein